RMSWFTLTLVLAACGGSDDSATDEGTDGQEPAAMSGATDAHNTVRAQASPAPAAPMQKLSWSSTIAGTAQAYANKCMFQHSGGKYGENLFAEFGSDSSAADVVASWASESAHYHYATNTCDSGQVCGHYTQLVWASTARFGCGKATCTANSPFPESGS